MCTGFVIRRSGFKFCNSLCISLDFRFDLIYWSVAEKNHVVFTNSSCISQKLAQLTWDY